MSKGLIAFIVVAGISSIAMLIMFLKSSADEAHKKSDAIVEEFKRVNEDLKKSNAAIIDSANKELFDSLAAKKIK